MNGIPTAGEIIDELSPPLAAAMSTIFRRRMIIASEFEYNQSVLSSWRRDPDERDPDYKATWLKIAAEMFLWLRSLPLRQRIILVLALGGNSGGMR